ncbi:MAG: hypothetical protein KAK00_06975 [Nanoarchaeota archaeon]|nr:hypothetical protein [Nanoarchaeota archaeon]
MNNLKIQDEQLAKIDLDISLLNDFFGAYLNHPDNPTAYSIIHEVFNKLSKDLNGLDKTALTEFERLIARQAKSGISAQKELSDFLINPREGDITSVVDCTYGGSSFKEIKDIILNFDVGEYKRFVSDSDIIRKNRNSVRKLGNPKEDPRELIKSAVMKYGKKLGIIDDSFDFNIIIDSIPRSYWESDKRICVISQDDFRGKEIDGLYVISLTGPYFTAIHEVLGHGFHQLCSEGVPETISYSLFQGSNIKTSAHREGVASEREHSAYTFLREHAKEYHIAESDLEFVAGYKEFAEQLTVVLTYKGLNDNKVVSDEKINKKIAQIDEIHRQYVYKDGLPSHSIRMALYEASYYFGRKKIREIKRQFNNFPANRVERALNTGVWAMDVLPDFMDYFLRKDK